MASVQGDAFLDLVESEMSCCEYIFHLNNESIICFQQGYHNSAIVNLYAALSGVDDVQRCPNSAIIMNSYAADDRLTSSETDATSHVTEAQTYQYAPLSARFMHWVKVGKPTAGVVVVRDNDPSCNSEALMYSYALVLRYDGTTCGATCDAVRAVLEYNLAYIHHWRAIHKTCASSELLLLWTALSYYKQAWNSIQQCEQESAAGAGMDHLALAVLNNMGHIHDQLLQFQQAQQCFHVLRLLISTRVGSISRLESMEDYQTFILSVMLPSPVDFVLAPAA